MKKPKLPKIEQVQVELFAKGLVIAMLGTDANEMTITQTNFYKDDYSFGDFEVKVTKLNTNKK